MWAFPPHQSTSMSKAERGCCSLFSLVKKKNQLHITYPQILGQKGKKNQGHSGSSDPHGARNTQRVQRGYNTCISKGYFLANIKIREHWKLKRRELLTPMDKRIGIFTKTHNIENI